MYDPDSIFIHPVLINDGGWGHFLYVLTLKAENIGQTTITVSPSGTSQNC
ncbi:MAG: hypothetical protein O4805_23820 [Trichodesmium sp. St16_bin2-tuft]|jgi:hypothetical protein|nr:hypothetical protein [Trichodesmium sp. St18_bin1]MDE5089984.1 hypothetical protein [Trichodesmium sp. St16_bin2-tuft]MDE5107320.1 hypothetical protein [Trichodesmium sp. St17_bin3_1_1]MDE5120065.1 hypothetical protein [Trichodesmium sp. St19_bin1]